jgi:hypothetical protein
LWSTALEAAIAQSRNELIKSIDDEDRELLLLTGQSLARALEKQFSGAFETLLS